MGLILSEDIAQIVEADERVARESFVTAQHRHLKALRRELDAERCRRLQAERLCDKQAGVIGEQAQELRTLHGESATPQAGCAFHWTTIGEADVLVEYQFHPEEGDGWEEPHYSASVEILQALINGKWVDASDVFSEDRIEDLRTDIEDWMAEQAADARISAAQE